MLELLQLCGDENVGPRKQFFDDTDLSETEHADASAYVIYVILAIVVVIFLCVAKSAYKKWKRLQELRKQCRVMKETRNKQQDQIQPATNDDNETTKQKF